MKRIIPTLMNNEDIKMLCFWLGITILSSMTIITSIAGGILIYEWLKTL